ncbi:maleylpyruvate isomerase family mycothiol-dependent enzyme [Nocardioides anomalus]|uniref:Maleylpyruvate isomerase family mycothiol-dependent enzyme n=1 Tax=Nocardioides anomalus TaxID=2712223 RepID=A0A6G6WIY7_9ACTN|nr:maleylpyruvate isomerase family mycothiol-dependent enzyme [Nocardioides anomalus]QIG45182.1 maleylpyruvate isomerase family mycothiol-dependent enzyme [Nocardioides anomalus]
MTGPDPIAEWSAAHERVCGLVEALSADALERRVPACPDWTARDLLAHMIGLGADVLAGDEPDDHHAGWTQAQVEARRDRSGAELVAEWRALAPDLVAWMADHGSRPLNDVVIHEQDLRSAVDRPGARDTAGFALVRDRMAERFGRSAPDGLALVGDTWRWGPLDAPTRLRASDFDLGRALTSRRTAQQLRSWTEAGDVAPYSDAFAGLGDLPAHALPE